MSEEKKEINEILKLPLKFDAKYYQFISADNKIIGDFYPRDLRDFSNDEIREIGEYVCESVNSRPSLEKRIAELESALEVVADGAHDEGIAKFARDALAKGE